MKVLYSLRGIVKEGAKRGKKIGFPTANIHLHQNIPEGVYTSTIQVNSKQYIAATFVGSAKTFHETTPKVESYILNFNEQIYGKWISIKLYKQLRGNTQFSSAHKLVVQIKKDVLHTRRYFSGHLINSK